MHDLMKRASALAHDLVDVDPNEAQKALSYLRKHYDPNAYFDYLQAIVENENVVIRSKQTKEYYKRLLKASEQHLQNLSPQDMAATLAWAIRLRGYYKVVLESKHLHLDVEVTDSSPPVKQAVSPSPRTSSPAQPSLPQSQPAPRSVSDPSSPSSASQTAPPTDIPQIGSVFTGNVLEVDETAVKVQVKNLKSEHVVGIIRADMIPDHNTSRYSVGNSARVEVVEVKEARGRIVVELKPAPKKK